MLKLTFCVIVRRRFLCHVFLSSIFIYAFFVRVSVYVSAVFLFGCAN